MNDVLKDTVIVWMSDALARLDLAFKSDPGLKGRLDTEVKSMSGDVKAKFGDQPLTAADRILYYKRSVGTTMFSALCNNTNLQSMADEHYADVAFQVRSYIVNRLTEFFSGTDVDRIGVVALLTYGELCRL